MLIDILNIGCLYLVTSVFNEILLLKTVSRRFLLENFGNDNPGK